MFDLHQGGIARQGYQCADSNIHNVVSRRGMRMLESGYQICLQIYLGE
jgi:hypothetical protein